MLSILHIYGNTQETESISPLIALKINNVMMNKNILMYDEKIVGNLNLYLLV